MVIDEQIRSRRDEILRVARANGATRVRVFGSIARGTARPDSDLDLLLELEPGRHLLDLVAIKQDLEDLLGREVHVVTEAAISPRFREAILRDVIPL
jgi:predicted nucleotidyltransferase